MTRFRIFLALSIFCCGSAAADIWKWVDANGETHFVSTQTAIYTWADEERVFYSDTPDHEDAVLVQLVWHSKGTLKDTEATVETMLAAAESSDGYAFPGETPKERAEREAAEAHHCKRVTEIYKSYENAPRLYRTNAKGDREYLSDKDAKATMDDAKSKMEQACR
ncbi:MAG: DUF4124 domain-containing protein [Gammaproteobacteria bacterium]|nr:DUF4124 domain-containing protein [Gammaproteobacteria bacterium]MDH5241171.1 DUF4124 domain-containing protein [Gammaproteobacteria bacterium]MDH5584494.1 DUF4124 domain-containing protein [Gammaproteobacteria bacterium]